MNVSDCLSCDLSDSLWTRTLESESFSLDRSLLWDVSLSLLKMAQAELAMQSRKDLLQVIREQQKELEKYQSKIRGKFDLSMHVCYSQ